MVRSAGGVGVIFHTLTVLSVSPLLVARRLPSGLKAMLVTPAARHRFASLFSLAADDAGLPDDPEFRSALVAYVEWGTRLALLNSQPGAEAVPQAPVPRWGWGEAPPFRP